MKTTYLEKLDQALIARRQAEGPRGHLGMSVIGNEDELKLWLDFRWCMPPIDDPRMLRIFANGDAVEDMLIRWTKDAGMRLETRAPDGQQFRFARLGGHFGGSMDGAILGVPEYPGEWLVWEAKSANDARFKGLKDLATDGQPPSWEDLETQGLKAWSPAYYGQVICYMGETSMRRAMVVIYDKNRSDLHVEFVEADPLAFETYVSKAERIITSATPPKSIYNSPTDWRCKTLMNEVERSIYWRERLPLTANCRNCRFSSPDLEATSAQWYCAQHGTLIGPVEKQAAGCPKHQFIPELVPARLIDTGADGASYISNDGELFTNGEGQFSSTELIELSKDEFAMLSDPFFKEAREQMGIKVKRVDRITQAIATHTENTKKPDKDEKIWDPWPDEDIPF